MIDLFNEDLIWLFEFGMAASLWRFVFTSFVFPLFANLSHYILLNFFFLSGWDVISPYLAFMHSFHRSASSHRNISVSSVSHLSLNTDFNGSADEETEANSQAEQQGESGEKRKRGDSTNRHRRCSLPG